MRKILTISVALAAVVALVLVDLCCGGMDVDAVVLTRFRLPRALSAMIAGAGLALAGLQMQAVFRNPLADPHIMGVSSGASLCAALVTMGAPLAIGSMVGGLTMAAAAFVGAVLASLIVLAVSTRIGNASTLLIFGVLMGFVVSALTTVLGYSASEQSLKVFYNWSAGNFAANSYAAVSIMACAVLASALMACLNHRGLDVIVFGDDYSTSVGADVRSIRRSALLSSCIVTGAVTAFCGPIGFVGIVGPHIARWIMGTSVHKCLVPSAMLMGAAVALCADMLTVLIPFPIPVASAMAFLGIPMIMTILICSRRTI